MHTDFNILLSGKRGPNRDAAENLARYHECLAKCDLLSESNPDVSQTWELLAAQWEMIIKLDHWSAARPQPHEFGLSSS
jgi:hypothetical protein